MISATKQRMKYMVADYVASNFAWFAYNGIRWAMGGVQGFTSMSAKSFFLSGNVLMGQLLFPLAMMVAYYLSGYYNIVFRKSRLQELLTTASSAFVNSLGIFFVALLNDVVLNDRTINYEMILLLWLCLFAFTYTSRSIITTHTTRQIRQHRWTFRTLVVGAGAQAVAFVDRQQRKEVSSGNEVVGYVAIPGENNVKDIDKPVYELEDLERVTTELGVEEIVVLPSRVDQSDLLRVVDRLYPLNIPIKISPDKNNVLLTKARMSNFYGDPLVDVSLSSMSESGKNIKRVLDVIISALVLLLLSPLLLVIAIMIKRGSKGPVIYSQERVGYHNKLFTIYKFRSMVDDAEAAGQPQLSSQTDPRITPIGRFLRKYRLDELPQFYNVLRGDMSLVGPRPERRYYVEQIVKRRPAYSLVHRVRPGITSMGQVKFGYAENIDEMIDRLDYDLLYLDNMSLLTDLKIMVYTLKIVITGKGV